MTFKQAAIALALVFVVVLAIVVAKQLSAEAMAVVIGVVCGVAAGIPTSLLLLVTLNQRERRRLADMQRQAGQATSPVVVIQGGAPQASQAGYWPAPLPGPAVNRQFHVVGGDELFIEDGDHWHE